MSVTVASLYSTLCYDLLEDGGLALGLVTQTEFLDMLGIVLMDFLRRTSIIRRPQNSQIFNATSTYILPDQNPEVFMAFVDAQIINRTEFANPANPYWPSATAPTAATVQHWHQDQMKTSVIELTPTPNFTSAGGFPGNGYDVFLPGNRNLTVIVSSIASQETWGSGDTLDTIPDTFTPYLIYGILEKIFSMNGEAKDAQRAMYCRARYEEGVALAKTIVATVMSEPEK